MFKSLIVHNANADAPRAHRKVRRAYESSWDQRCRMFFCCSLASNRKIRVSIQMTDIMTRTRVSHSGYSQL